MQKIIHQIPPVWNSESQVLILGTMPSPKSREAGFFYMHPQNRFWKVLPAVFGESLLYPNNFPDRQAAISERRDFLIRHHIALWDVIGSCDIEGSSDSSIRNVSPNELGTILERADIRQIYVNVQTAYKYY